MSRQKRVTITLKLLPGKDTDLIGWWLSIPAGSRQSVLKGILRVYVQQTLGLPPQDDDTAWIRETLAALLSYLEQVIARVAVTAAAPVQKSASGSEPDTALTSEQVNRRERKIARARW